MLDSYSQVALMVIRDGFGGECNMTCKAGLPHDAHKFIIFFVLIQSSKNTLPLKWGIPLYINHFLV